MRTMNVRSRLMIAAMGLLLPALLATSPLVAGAAHAKGGDDLRHRGWVQARPATGFVGNWTIGGKTFKVTSGAQIDQEEGLLVKGACAKVKYRIVNGAAQVLELDSEPASDCR
jgi:hypothetical protein